ncbi:tetratricopeptide repeat protein, partial [Verrucomicrobiota bacterium]
VIPGRDFQDCPGLWVIIDHLPPKASASFRIRNQSFKVLPPGEHCLFASVAFYTNALPATLRIDDGAPLTMIGPRSDLMGMKTSGPGRIRIVTSMHTTPIDGADIVSNATCLIKENKWDEAERELTRAIRQNPSLGVAYGNRSVLRMRRGSVQDAYQDAQKAVVLLPNDSLAHANLADCLRLLGRKEEALTSQTRAVTLAGTNMPRLIYEKGVVLSELNRPVGARMEFDRAILLGFTNEWVRYSKGVTFLKENSFSNAITEFNAAIAICPDMADALFARSIAFGRSGQLRKADQDIREAIRLKPSLTNTFESMGIRVIHKK